MMKVVPDAMAKCSLAIRLVTGLNLGNSLFVKIARVRLRTSGPSPYLAYSGSLVHWCHEEREDSSHNVNFGSGDVQLITTKEAWDEKLSEASRNDKIVVANFSASWCGPCRMIAPFYSELSEKYPSLMFLTVDVDELTEFSSSWDIRATPTFFFLRDGQQIDKLVGANKPELQKKLVAVADSSQTYK